MGKNFLGKEGRKVNLLRKVLILTSIPIVIFLQFFIISGGRIAKEVIPDPIPPKALTCFDAAQVLVFESNTELGCASGSRSLGTEPIPSETADIGILNPLLLLRFQAAQAIAAQVGIPLRITSGYRSRETQAKLFADEVIKLGSETEAAKWVLPPLYSHHPQGTAIDVNYNFDRPSTKWLEINGYKFGLCRAYANEWWHFEGLTSPGVPCPPMKVNALVDVPNGTN
jgi:hypothetical protein